MINATSDYATTAFELPSRRHHSRNLADAPADAVRRRPVRACSGNSHNRIHGREPAATAVEVPGTGDNHTADGGPSCRKVPPLAGLVHSANIGRSRRAAAHPAASCRATATFRAVVEPDCAMTAPTRRPHSFQRRSFAAALSSDASCFAVVRRAGPIRRPSDTPGLLRRCGRCLLDKPLACKERTPVLLSASTNGDSSSLSFRPRSKVPAKYGSIRRERN